MKIRRLVGLSMLLVFCFCASISFGANNQKLDQSIYDHYNKRFYSEGGKKYDIFVFKSDPNKESIKPLVYTNGNKQKLSEMVDPMVIAKINGNVMQSYTNTGDAFYGLFYANGVLYSDGVMIDGNDPMNFPVLDEYSYNYYPSFCVKNDGTANIRWFTKTTLKDSLDYCTSIFAINAALVYDSKSVFEENVYDSGDGGKLIYNLSNPADKTDHANDAMMNGGFTRSTNRTLVGHKPDGSYLLVCTSSMNLETAARLMKYLGCDYAGNLDGASAFQMRVANGFTNGAKAGRVTPIKFTFDGTSDTFYYGTALGIYIK